MHILLDLFIILAALTALCVLGSILGTKRRRKILKLFNEALRTPARFYCGAELCRVNGDAEAYTTVCRDGVRAQFIPHGEYFLRCPDACVKKATCSRLKALADRCGELTPISLALAHVHQAYLVDEDLTIREILDPETKVHVALVRAAVLDRDLQPPELPLDPTTGADCIREKLDDIVY